jgi:hypothetical protein
MPTANTSMQTTQDLEKFDAFLLSFGILSSTLIVWRRTPCSQFFLVTLATVLSSRQEIRALFGEGQGVGGTVGGEWAGSGVVGVWWWARVCRYRLRNNVVA